jgi:hypothetical protein
MQMYEILRELRNRFGKRGIATALRMYNASPPKEILFILIHILIERDKKLRYLIKM